MRHKHNTRMIVPIFSTCLAAFVGLMMLSACENENTFEEAGEEIDEAIEEVQDEIDDMTDDDG